MKHRIFPLVNWLQTHLMWIRWRWEVRTQHCRYKAKHARRRSIGFRRLDRKKKMGKMPPA